MSGKAKPQIQRGMSERATALLRFELLRTYKPSMLLGDIAAGIVIFIVTIPAAMAYGALAGLKPINGLYASLLAMGIYAFFGTSRHLIVDAEAAVAILVASSIASIAGGNDPARFATLAFLQAIMVGGMQVVAGFGRLGFVSDFIPKSVISGFINGVALIIIVAQLGKFSGIELHDEGFILRLIEFISKFNEVHQISLKLGAACLVGLFFLRFFIRRIPEAVVVVALATFAVFYWGLDSQGVKLVGDVPAGLPHLLLPAVGYRDILDMLPIAVGVALVSFVDTTITGRAFALRGGYRLDHNQELLALGLTNIGTGLFQGFAVGSSHSRTAVNVMYGGRSQFAGLVAAACLGVFLVYFTGTISRVPMVALAAIIITAGLRLLMLQDLITAFRTDRTFGYISIITTLAVLITGLMTGILVSVAFAIILVLFRLARPHEIIIRTPKAPGLLIYRFGAPLFFFNAAYFVNRVQEIIDASPDPVTFFLINAEAIVDMDLNAAELLEDLHFSLKAQGIGMGICEVKGHFRRVLMSTHLPNRVGFTVYPSVAVAVRKMSNPPEDEKKEVAKKETGEEETSQKETGEIEEGKQDKPD
jgi:sulfate permease, SulP family